MAFLFSFAILCALAISTPLAADPHVTSVGFRCAGVGVCTLLLPILAFSVRWFALSRLQRSADQARIHLRSYVIAETFFPCIWFVVTILALFVFNWQGIVRTAWHLETFLLDEILLLLPVVMPWVLTWAVQYDIENWNNTIKRSRGQFVAGQARSLLGLVVVPLLFVAGCWDAYREFLPVVAASHLGWMAMLVPLALLFVAFPVFLRMLWPTRQMTDASLRDELFDLASNANVVIRDIVVWQTPNGTPNAAVAGLIPSLRYVFLTESLTERFQPTEVQATFAHELGHIRFHHNGLRMLALILPVIVLGCIVSLFSLSGSSASQTHSTPVNGNGPEIVLSCLGITIVYLFFVFGWFCRQLEHQADWFACKLLSEKLGETQALESYLAVLDRLAIGSPRDQREWLHPSWQARERFLRATVSDSDQLGRFQARMQKLVTAVGILTMGGSFACLLQTFTR